MILTNQGVSEMRLLMLVLLKIKGSIFWPVDRSESKRYAKASPIPDGLFSKTFPRERMDSDLVQFQKVSVPCQS